jgi:hypothetical protein
VRIFGGTGIELIGNDLSSRLGTCVYVAEVVPTTSLTVERNRIHDCGERSGSPNLFGLSIGNADTVRIAGNVFFGIRDAGVVGYPQLDNAVITGNTFVDIRIPIDVGGTSDDLASGNITVERNVLAGQSEQHLKTSFEADVSPGERNLVARRNCLEPGSSISGLFREEDNDLASAVFVDPAAEDYRQAPGSPCLGRGADLPPPTPGG